MSELTNHLEEIAKHLSSKLREIERDRDEWRAQAILKTERLENLQSYLREYLTTPPVRTEFDGVAKRQELRKKLEELSR